MPDDFDFDTFDAGDALAQARWADPNYIADKYRYEVGKFWLGRNPHDFDQMIGVPVDKHILITAETRSGKGRTLIIPNLLLWQGSTVVYDPKGEIPSIVSPARGEGGWRCRKGLGQKQFVLDPLGRAEDADPLHIGYFDPLWGLDPDDPDLRAWVERIAHTLVKKPKDSGSAEWTGRAVRLLSVLIEYVVTSPIDSDDPKDGTLFEVIKLAYFGRDKTIDTLIELEIEEGLIKADPDKGVSLGDAIAQRRASFGDGHIELLREIVDKREGWLADEARSIIKTAERTTKYFENIRSEIADRLRWLTTSENYQAALTGFKNGERVYSEDRRFDPRELKTNPDGISVYIVMPSDEMETHSPWVQMVITSILASMRRTRWPRGAPKHEVLGIIDEFSSLGDQEYMATGMDNIRGAGLILAIVLQNFGKLQEMYKTAKESFINNTSIKLFFGDVGETAKDFIVKECGETEIIKYQLARTRTESEAHGTTENLSSGQSSTRAEGGATSHAETRTSAQGGSHSITTAHGKQRSISASSNRNVNWSNGASWGKGNGKTTGANYGPMPFFQLFADSNNYGTSLNKSSGKNNNKGGSRGTSTGTSQSDTRTESVAKGKNWNESQSEAVTHTQNYTNSETISEQHSKGWSHTRTVAEGFTLTQTRHKRPLIEYQEFRTFFGALREDEFDEPAYPGFMLALIGKEPATFIRRTNYDQDPFFEGLFEDHPLYGFLRLNSLPLLGHEISVDHIVQLEVPPILVEEGFEAEMIPRRHTLVKKGEPLVLFRKPDGEEEVIPARELVRVLHNKGETIESFGTVRCVYRDREGDKVYPISSVTNTFERFSRPLLSARENKRRYEEERLAHGREQQAKLEARWAEEARQEAEALKAQVVKLKRQFQFCYLTTIIAVVGFVLANCWLELFNSGYGSGGPFKERFNLILYLGGYSVVWVGAIWSIQTVVCAKGFIYEEGIRTIPEQWSLAFDCWGVAEGSPKGEKFAVTAAILILLCMLTIIFAPMIF